MVRGIFFSKFTNTLKVVFIYLFVINVLFFSAQNSLLNKLPNNSKSIWRATPIKNKDITTSINENNTTLMYSKDYITQTNSVFKKYILSKANVAYSNDVIETTPNNYVLIGQTYDTIAMQLHWRLTLTGIDQNYNQVWKKSYGNNNFTYTHEIFNPMRLIKKNNFLYSAFFVFDSTNKQPGVFIKFNFNGDTIWQKKYYVNNDEFYITSVCQSVDNGFFITGAVQTNTPSYNNHPIVATYLLKTDADGNKLWDKRFYKTNLDETQMGYKIIQDTLTKKIIIVGVQDNNTRFSNIIILDSLGNLITQKGSNGTYGSALVDVIKLKDGNFITVGTTSHPEFLITGTPTSASTLLKFDIAGNILLKKEFDSLVVNNVFYKIVEGRDGDLYTGGQFSTLQQYNMGLNDVSRVAKIDKNGNLVWKKYFDNYTNNSNQDGLSAMIQSSDGNIVFTNYLNGGNVPRPLNYSFYKTDTTSCDANAIGCYTYVGLKQNELSKQKIKIYPNPATNFCILNFSELSNLKTVILEVKNTLGRIIFKTTTNESDYNLNTTTFNTGLYFISVTQNNQLIAEEKLIILK